MMELTMNFADFLNILLGVQIVCIAAALALVLFKFVAPSWLRQRVDRAFEHFLPQL